MTGVSDPKEAQAETAAPEVPVASNDPIPPDAPAASVEPATPGALLRAAREQAGLSVADVANRLRMGGRQVDALERGDYASLPTGTFLRGFIRNYARAVSADAAKAISLLEQTQTAPSPAPSIIPPSQNIKLVPAGGELATPKGRIAIGLGVLAFLALAVTYWWVYVRPTIGENVRAEQAVEVAPPAQASAESAPVAAPASVAPVPAEPKPVPVTESTPVPVEAKPAAPVHPAETKPTVAAASAAEAKPAIPVKRGAGSVGFTFTGESWVEVTDADSRVLISRRFRAGEAEEATGRTPLSVVIGNAQVTRMAVNGQEFDLVPYTRVSVARVTIK